MELSEPAKPKNMGLACVEHSRMLYAEICRIPWNPSCRLPGWTWLPNSLNSQLPFPHVAAGFLITSHEACKDRFRATDQPQAKQPFEQRIGKKKLLYPRIQRITITPAFSSASTSGIQPEGLGQLGNLRVHRQQRLPRVGSPS